jgi:hypothetical protein
MIDMNAVRPGKHPGTETLQQVPFRIELQDWIYVILANAAVLPTTFGHPDCVVLTGVHGAGCAPFPALREFRPTIYSAPWMFRRGRLRQKGHENQGKDCEAVFT